MPWVHRFPDEFFRQLYRLYGWEYKVGNRKMPQCVGKFINTYVYGALPPGVLEKLQELNPVSAEGHRAVQHHRLLTDTGNSNLDRQITSTITVMALSDDKDAFKQNFNRFHLRTIPAPKEVPLKLEALPPPRETMSLFPDLQ
jgi:hypothetical protein